MLGYTTTIMPDLPSHYDSLEQTLQSAESILEDAIRNAKNLFHTPVISSHSNEGIQTRTVVLRDFIQDSRIIRFHTDLRSPKVAELQANPAATMQGYDPSIKIQLRMLGSAEVHHQDAVTEAAWAETREMSKECYSVAD
ncbi:MAG: pyridoxamine 5'-phosphate oxidase, partial [Gammaproteobacteria bacterium]|nr:pyridoxamine 5'-phosphate oxidase [Gammaproteobacteria bacterium]